MVDGKSVALAVVEAETAAEVGRVDRVDELANLQRAQKKGSLGSTEEELDAELVGLGGNFIQQAVELIVCLAVGALWG